MDSKIKVFILGSCVSRDPFEMADKRDFDLVAYYARMSFASLGAKPQVDDKILSSIESNWQHRMLTADMNKSVFNELRKAKFDVLLIDLIDERFNLAINGNSIHTMSTEYQNALYRPNNYSFIKANSNEKRQLWLKGLNKLAAFLKQHRLDHRVVINRVYWSQNCDNQEKLFQRFPVEKIQRTNKELSWMYGQIEKALPKARFIDYSNAELKVDENHKWSLSPFHYGKDAFKRQLLVLFGYGVRGKSFSVRHPLGNQKITFPINWVTDPFTSASWLHNFVSLRWLKNSASPLFIHRVLASFYNFHCKQQRNNPYYNTLKGDHTSAIRLDVFSKIYQRFSDCQHPALSRVTKALIIAELGNLQRPAMHRQGHNHALIVDIALLEVYRDWSEFRNQIDLPLILQRSAETLDMMWDSSGVTKEHSVSYQEFNLPLVKDYFGLLQELQMQSKTKVSLTTLLQETKKFLGLALRSNGQYWPLGDSLRLPNVKLLNQLYGDGESTPEELLKPYSEQEGTYANSRFFIFRKTVNGRKIHFAATCCWDSANHKQNDELHFCLEVDGVTVFDDPGYSGLLPAQQLKAIKSEHAHSTITVEGCEWQSDQDKLGPSYLSGKETDNGFSLVMTMQRIVGTDVTRQINFNGQQFEISDKITIVDADHSDQPREIRTRFVFGENIEADAESDGSTTNIALRNSNNHVATLSYLSEGRIDVLETQPRVLADKSKCSHGISLVSKQVLCKLCENTYWLSIND